MARFNELYEAGARFKVTSANNPKGREAGEILIWTGEETWWCGCGYVPRMRAENGDEFWMRPYYLEHVENEE